jgi:hypothetical protein
VLISRFFARLLRPDADAAGPTQRVFELHAERAAIEAEPARSTVRRVDAGKRMGDHCTASPDHARVIMLRQVAVFVVHARGRDGGRVETVDAVQEPERFAQLSQGLPDPFAYSIQRQSV